MKEYEYTFKVRSIEPYINYCKKMVMKRSVS